MEKHLNIVVHGIGEHRPGETLDMTIAGAFGSADARVESASRLLPEQPAEEPSAMPHTYPCEVRRVMTADREFVFAEAYWADLSRGKEGVVSTFLSLMSLMVNLSHVIRENAAQETGPGSTRYRFIKWFLALIYGPILAMNTVLLIGIPMKIFAFWLIETPLGPKSPLLTTVILAICALILGARLNKRPQLSWIRRRFGTWVIRFGWALLLYAACVAVLPLPGEPSDAAGLTAWMTNHMIVVMQTIYLMATGLLVICAAQWAIAQFTPHRKALPLHISAAAGMIVILFFISGTFWASIAHLLTTSSWPPVVAFSSVIQDSLVKVGLRSLPIVHAMVAVVLVFTVYAILKRRHLLKTEAVGTEVPSEPPRLILAAPIGRALVLVVALFLVWAILRAVLTFGGSDWFGAFDTALKQFAEQLDEFLPFFIAPAAALGSFYAYHWRIVAFGVALGHDVVSYFIRIHTQYPVRTRIQRRLEQIVETMVASERPDRLTILSHSQGTIISLEFIRTSETWAALEQSGVQTRQLVTMGSPHDHLYRFYFKGRFAEAWSPSAKLDRWLNIFRIDDPIGTRINTTEALPENIPVPARGHTGYWIDQDVQQHLKAKIWSL